MIRLVDLEVYKISMEIGENIWNIVDRWNTYQKDTLGKQLTRAADSIALNISEGYGRFHYKDNKNFCYYSRGSAFETQSALTKAKQRNLMTKDEFELLKSKLDLYFKMINSYIKSIGQKSQ
ncbi:MAG: four helix bundle protein [Chitinophagales bacterium]